MAKNRIEELTSRPLITSEDSWSGQTGDDSPPDMQPEPSPSSAPQKPEPPQTVVLREDQTVPTRREHSLLPATRKPRAASSQQPPIESVQPSPEPEKTADPQLPGQAMSGNNEQKLRQATLHLARYFQLADGEQIEGRKFYGETTITVKWRNGQAGMILPRMEQSDTGTRDGK